MSFHADRDPRFAVIEESMGEVTASERRTAALLSPAYADCGVCLGYFHRRHRILFPHIVTASMRRGLSTRRIVHEFLLGVHDRHVKGLAL